MRLTAPSKSSSFRVGTVIAKTFAFPRDARDPSQGRRLIETRILKREPDGWVGLPYIWNKEQTEATLDVAGDMVDVSWIHTDGRTRTDNYIIPNANQCKGCHKAGEIMRPIGPKARNLNRDFAYPTEPRTSCVTGAVVVCLPALRDPAAAPRLAVWDDPQERHARCSRPRLARNQLRSLPQSRRAGAQLGARPSGIATKPDLVRDQQASGGRRHRLGRPGFRHRTRPARQIDPGLSDRLDPSGHHDARTGQATRARGRGGLDPRVDRGDAGAVSEKVARGETRLSANFPARARPTRRS